MKKYYLLLIPLLFVPIFIFAQSLDDISYPIEELGNCQNAEDCSKFCDKIVNLEACHNFSKENMLSTTCDTVDVGKFVSALKNGVQLLPCETKAECLDFCSRPENLNQCLAFAEKSGILSRYEALLFKRTGGIGPGGCKTKEECKEYCGKEDNVDECLAFAKEYGFMSQGQVAEAVRLRDIALKGGPGGCVGLEQCKDYCSVSSNFEECINFGTKTGIIAPEEIEKVQEFVSGGGPGGCKTRQECDAYCEDPENNQECFTFLVENNYISQEKINLIDEGIKETEQSVEAQIQEYKEKLNLTDEEVEEIRTRLKERLQPYKDIFNIEE
jgi:hypothetical protein